MKKIITAILVSAMLVSMSSCVQVTESEKDNESDVAVTTSSDESVADEANGDEDESESDVPDDSNVITKEGISIALESCRFTKSIHAIDGEYIGNSFSESEGKVYVDAVFYVSANDRAITEEDVSGYFMYDTEKYTMNYSYETDTCVSLKDYTDYPENYVGRIHLSAMVDEAAMTGGVEANLNIMGETVTVPVDPIDNSDPLSKKTEVKVGDEIVTASGIKLSIRACEIVKEIYASDIANSSGHGLAAQDMILHIAADITNGSESPIYSILNYSVTGDGIVRGACGIETDNNTKISSIDSDGILPGESEIIHLYSTADDSDNILRFNLDGVCYYFKG